jgi:arylsulfatase A-like enzyme
VALDLRKFLEVQSTVDAVSQTHVQRGKIVESLIGAHVAARMVRQDNRTIHMRRFLPVLLALSALSCREAAPPPNIVFIFSDDHGRQAVGAYGSVINETPNIDRIAREGALFTNALVTNSICAPSRATVLTGRYNHVNGQLTNAETFDGSQDTFPKLLQQAGYQTALVGKWHLKSAPTGFDFWRVLIGQGPYYNPPIGSSEDTVRVPGYTTDLVTDIALDWLREGRDPSRPFLLMFQHKAPHRNWQPGPDHLSDYEDVDVPVPATFFDNHSGRTRAAAEATMGVARNLTANDLKIAEQAELDAEQRRAWDAVYGPHNEAVRAAALSDSALTRWKYQRYAKDYLRSVQSLDDNIGRMLDYLDESGLSGNTIVVYMSDQGWYLGEHGWYDKRWMYEPSLRTPFLVRWPGVAAASAVSDALVSNVDVAPTLLDAAGVAVPDGMQGASILPLLRASRSPETPAPRPPLELVEAGPPGAEVPSYGMSEDPAPTFGTPAGWRRSFYYHYYEYPGWHCVRRHYGVRTDRYKLIHFYTLGEWELFDLAEDPDELRSVYDDPAYAAVREELHAELDRLRSELSVPEDDRPDGEGECTLGGEGWTGYGAE